MGFYITLTDSKNNTILERKYSLGMPMIMFEDYTYENGHLIFAVDGQTAINNLNNAISRIKNILKTNQNDMVIDVLYSLENVRNYLRKDETYYAELSEALMYVENPTFDPHFFIWEVQQMLTDLETGYNKRVRDTKNYVRMLTHFIDHLSPSLESIYAEKNNENVTILNATYNLSVAEKNELAKIYFKPGDSHQKKDYIGRKIYSLLISAFPNFELLHREGNNYYLIFTKQDIENWVNTKPYVNASYKTNYTYDIPYILRNTPEEKEKFICYFSEKGDAVSIKIDGAECINLSDSEISTLIGKEFKRCSCDSENIDMKYVG